MTSWDAQYRDQRIATGPRRWDVLIATIPHRHGKLCALLAELNRQWQPGLGVIVYRDNLEAPVGVKRQALLKMSRADYVSFIDDDDEVSPVFVRQIMIALDAGPDYVGFLAEVWLDGVYTAQAEHSLRHSSWRGGTGRPDRIARDLSHLNPIRRELALRGDFGAGHDEEDRDWAQGVRDSGAARVEVLVPEVMYVYKFSGSDCHNTVREPFSPDDIEPLPAYPWLVAL